VQKLSLDANINVVSEAQIDQYDIMQSLVARGYQEVGGIIVQEPLVLVLISKSRLVNFSSIHLASNSKPNTL
jgi:hypothetical protein